MGGQEPSQSPATRVDPAHVMAGEQPAVREIAESVFSSAGPAESTASVTAHQVRLQAAQLATQLQHQQAAVDHRESEINARLAAVENQIRSARLWLDERHADLAAQKAELDRRSRELETREAQAADSFSRARRSGRAKDGNREDLDAREAELDRRQQELEQMAASLAQRLERAERNGDAGYNAERLNTFRQNLERAEILLSNQQAEWERKRRELDDQRARFAESMQIERRKFAVEQQRAGAEHERIAQELKRQGDELAARHAALERMQADVKRAQQEALEIRLATEELWSRLCGTMAPAALAQSLAQLRLKLAEEQRLERAELAAERAEVQSLTEQLAQQHARLRDARADFQAWAKAQREDLERHAGQLAARERQIEEQIAHERQKADEWENERLRLEQEIRRLLRQPESAHSVAAA